MTIRYRLRQQTPEGLWTSAEVFEAETMLHVRQNVIAAPSPPSEIVSGYTKAKAAELDVPSENRAPKTAREVGFPPFLASRVAFVARMGTGSKGRTGTMAQILFLEARPRISASDYVSDQRTRIDAGLPHDPIDMILTVAEDAIVASENAEEYAEALEVLGVDVSSDDVKDAAEEVESKWDEKKEAFCDALLSLGVEVESRDDNKDILEKATRHAENAKAWTKCLVDGLATFGANVDDGSEDVSYAEDEIQSAGNAYRALLAGLVKLGAKIDTSDDAEAIEKEVDRLVSRPANDIRRDDPGEVMCLRAYVAELERERDAAKRERDENAQSLANVKEDIRRLRVETENRVGANQVAGYEAGIAEGERRSAETIASLRSDIAEQERLTAEAERRVSAARAAGWSEAFPVEKELRAYVAALEAQVKRLESGIAAIVATAKRVTEGGEVK